MGNLPLGVLHSEPGQNSSMERQLSGKRTRDIHFIAAYSGRYRQQQGPLSAPVADSEHIGGQNRAAAARSTSPATQYQRKAAVIFDIDKNCPGIHLSGLSVSTAASWISCLQPRHMCSFKWVCPPLGSTSCSRNSRIKCGEFVSHGGHVIQNGSRSAGARATSVNWNCTYPPTSGGSSLLVAPIARALQRLDWTGPRVACSTRCKQLIALVNGQVPRRALTT